MNENDRKLEFKKSKTDLTIPVINGVYLHSIYDPKQEAKQMITDHAEQLKNKNKILILGLGYGYHIDEAINKLSEKRDDYQIVVIEPNLELIQNFNQHKTYSDDRVQILHVETAEELYNQFEFVRFLMDKPAVLKLETSFTMDKDFYLSILNYNAAKEIPAFTSLLSESAKKIVARDSSGSLDSYLNQYQQQRIKNYERGDFLALAFKSVIHR